MSKNSKKKNLTVVPKNGDTPAEGTAPETTVAVSTEPKAKKVKYAPKGDIANEKAVIRMVVQGNPKRNKAGARFAQFHKDGQTVGDYIKAQVDAGNKAGDARADLRWDLRAGHIRLEQPEA